LRGKLGHKLVPEWKRFKKLPDHTALTQFDAVVANLDRWQRSVTQSFLLPVTESL
jgi:hypothetical protein